MLKKALVLGQLHQSFTTVTPPSPVSRWLAVATFIHANHIYSKNIRTLQQDPAPPQLLLTSRVTLVMLTGNEIIL